MNKTYSIIGKQYGHYSSAMRAIRNFKKQNANIIPNGFEFWANRLDEGCYEIEGENTLSA